jgi:hypothetical protein
MKKVLEPLAMRYWRGSLKRNLNNFTEEVFGFINADHQREWYSILENKRLTKVALAAPRGHTKSTCFSVNYPLFEIARNPDVRILLVSNAETQAQSFLREIVGHVERNQLYVDFAGQLKPDIPERWTNKEIIVKRNNLKLKDPTISTVGMGGTILSKRVDIIICDDILNLENTRTVDQRQKVKQWFHEVLLPILVPGGRVIFVGTVWHPQDLLSELLKDAGWDYRKKFKAVIQEPMHRNLWDEWYAIRMKGTPESVIEADDFYYKNEVQMYEGVKVMWPEYFTYSMLYLLMRTNRVAFEKAYQNNIVSREDQKFKEEWIASALMRGENYRLMRTLSNDQRKEMKSVAGGVDLAAGEDEQDDDNAMVTLGHRRLDDMVQLLGLDVGKFTPKEWRKTIEERAVGFKHDRIVVETNGYQVALKRDLSDKNLPIVAFHTGGEKLDPYIGVESLAILFENDRIILPYDKSDPATIAAVDRLVDELRQFPVGHTGDCAMALWFAYTAMRDLGGTQQSGFMQIVKKDLENINAGKPVGLPGWKQMANRQQ